MAQKITPTSMGLDGPAGLGQVPTINGDLATSIPPTTTTPSQTQALQGSLAATQAANQASFLPPAPTWNMPNGDPGNWSSAWVTWFATFRRAIGGYNPKFGDDAILLEDYSETVDQQSRDAIQALYQGDVEPSQRPVQDLEASMWSDRAPSQIPDDLGNWGDWGDDTKGWVQAQSYLNGNAAAITQTSAAPTGTASTTSVMMGIGATITPKISNRLCITISGQMTNGTVSDGATVDLRYGTGTAPINGAAVTGTLAGIAQTTTAKTAGQTSGFSITAIVSGLVLGTAYWIDASLKAVTGGTASITGVTICAIEV